jgi:creatine kinase
LYLDKVDSFPDLSRHGSNSLLREVLTREVYEKLRERRTASGVTVEDLIRAGVCLPDGAHPPRGVAGVYAGDSESYRTFAELLQPIIEHHHRHKKGKRVGMPMLQRHRTNLNPYEVDGQELDPGGQYILYTRMRLARSLKGFCFAPCISRQERRAVEQLLKECVTQWGFGEYISIKDMTNQQHDDLIRRQLLFPDPAPFDISSGLGRDWPDGRGVFFDSDWKQTPGLIIWCNSQDHVWIMSNAAGGNVQAVFTRLSQAATALEDLLKERGHAFVEDPVLGFLNTSPKDLGTALRASVHIKLVRLGRLPGFAELLRRLRLEARPLQKDRYSGMFDVGNAERLGHSEVQLINTMIRGVAVLIGLEKKLERGEEVDLDSVQV